MTGYITDNGIERREHEALDYYEEHRMTKKPTKPAATTCMTCGALVDAKEQGGVWYFVNHGTEVRHPHAPGGKP